MTATMPPPTLATVRSHREDIIKLVGEYGASHVRVVGSVARGDAKAGSDVDLLMTIPEGTSVFDLVGMWLDLKELLGFEVSIIPDSTSNQAFLASVLEDVVSL